MIHYQYHTIKLYDLFQFRKEKPASGQNEVRADIFSGSLAVCLFASASRRGERKGGWGGIPPALQILGEICSDIFKYTPPDRSLEPFEEIKNDQEGRKDPIGVFLVS